jgi:RNA polymerase sigma factor (sigma-70 family)
MEHKHTDFLELLIPCQKPLSAYIHHMLWDKKDTEDTMQNVLTEAYRKFGQFQAGTNLPVLSGRQTGFRNWIYQIAHFTVFNINRQSQKARTRQMPLDDNPDFVAPGIMNNPDYQKLLAGQDMVLEQLSDQVKSAMDILNDNERAVFLLRSLGEFDYAGIAQMLAIPPGSVMGHLARARMKLRNQLTNYAKEQGLL